MDLLSALWELYSSSTHNLPAPVFSFLVRANLLLLLPIAAAYAGYSQGVRNARVQTSLMATGMLAGLSVPIHALLSPAPWRPWAVMVLVFGCWYLPLLFARLAHPYRGTQDRIVKYTRIAIAVLFILNLFMAR